MGTILSGYSDRVTVKPIIKFWYSFSKRSNSKYIQFSGVSKWYHKILFELNYSISYFKLPGNRMENYIFILKRLFENSWKSL